MTTLTERIKRMMYIFERLEMADGLNERKDIVEHIGEDIKDDFYFCLEVLDGRHKLGYTYNAYFQSSSVIVTEDETIKSVYLNVLQMPLKMHDLSQFNIDRFANGTYEWADFFEPLCNRKYRLGIGQSLLPKLNTSPMLAKKYQGYIAPHSNGYFITEKLDGNRCIAKFNGKIWEFTSRNGRPMNVDFDMSEMDHGTIYDGEILSPEQVEMSEEIERTIHEGLEVTTAHNSLFNSTSGLINRKTKNKRLVYNIFDTMDTELPYYLRRRKIDQIVRKDDVRVLPTLMKFQKNTELSQKIDELLYKVTSIGGEGIMINLAGATYLNKRTDALLKYKEIKSMDMKVIGVYGGTGKYEGLLGGLECYAELSDGKIVSCKVGTGLSDLQRRAWRSGDLIIGKIVEVEYFSMSQDKENEGTNFYSLRFPRLKRVRDDKTSTSEY